MLQHSCVATDIRPLAPYVILATQHPLEADLARNASRLPPGARERGRCSRENRAAPGGVTLDQERPEPNVPSSYL